jgi:hypothetical protein
LPAPPASAPASPWKAVDGVAFLLGTLGVAGLLSRTRAVPAVAWTMAQSVSRPGRAREAFWGPVQGPDLARLAVPT